LIIPITFLVLFFLILFLLIVIIVVIKHIVILVSVSLFGPVQDVIMLLCLVLLRKGFIVRVGLRLPLILSKTVIASLIHVYYVSTKHTKEDLEHTMKLEVPTDKTQVVEE